MGYVSCISACIICDKMISFNPDLVPSLRVTIVENAVKPDPHGSREPLCVGCATVINANRVKAGLEPCPIHPNAYGPQEVT